MASWPDQRVDPTTGLKAISLWAAKQYGEDKMKGSIEVGKLADFVVLSDNPTTIDRLKISEIKVLKTIKQDKLIYELKSTTAKQQSISCIESNKCQEMLAGIDLNYGFGQLLSHNHSH